MDEKKDYKVIHETIIPKKKSRLKKIMTYLGIAIVGAILFGGIERVAFELSGKLFFEAQKEKKTIALTSDVELKKEMEVSTPQAVNPSKKREEKTTTIVKKDIKVVEKKIPATLLDYDSIMSEFGKVAVEGNKAVVEVRSVIVGTDWFENPYETVISTAGFVIAKQSDYIYILTKYSEIKKAGNIKLLFDNGLEIDGILKNFNVDLDLALLFADTKKIQEEKKKEVEVANLSQLKRITLGQPVMALGNPDGRMYSALFGVINNVKGREYVSDYVLDSFYSDIKMSPKGTSLLMDIYGKVIGIAIGNEEEGSCKVLSTGRVVDILEKMINDEAIPYLGIKTKSFEGAENKTGISGGILIDSVDKDSPAEKAGLKKGDIIYYLDDKKIENMEHFSAFLEQKKVEEEVKIKIYRVTRNQGKELELEAIIGDSRGIK